MERRKQKAKGARLHRGFDSDRSTSRFTVLEHTHDPITGEAADEMEHESGELQRHTSAQNAGGAVRNCSADEDDGGSNTDDRGERFNASTELRHVLVQSQTENDGHKNNLDGGNRHAHGVHVDDGAQSEFANERSHEDAADGGGGSHEYRERDITPGDVSAQVARLTAVD